MSHKIRLNRLEKMESGDRLWALIGIGKPKDAQHQRLLETQARHRFYSSGGNKKAYLAFLPFDSFPEGFYTDMSRKVSSLKLLQTRPRLLGKPNGTPVDGTSNLEKQGVCPSNRSGTCLYL